MSDRVQDLTNHRKVAVACKNYTDTEIKKSEERILSIVARNNVDFIDHINEPTYRFTAPANAKLLMLQSIAGNSVKYSPSVASDNTVAHIKTLPSTVYDLDVSKVEGVGYKVNQLVQNGNFVDTNSWGIAGGTFSVSNNVGSLVLDGSSAYPGLSSTNNLIVGHKYLITLQFKGNSYLGLNFGGYDANIASDLDSTVFTRISAIKECTTARVNFSFYVRRNDTPSGTLEFKTIVVFDLTADFGSGNEPTSVSDCATAYLQRGINIYEYTPQQSSIKNNTFTGVTSKDSSDNVIDTRTIDLTTIKDSNNVSLFPSGKMMGNSSVADFITPYNQESRWNEIDLSTCEWTQVGATTSGYYVWRTTSITDIKYVANNTQVGNGVYSKGKIRMASGMTGNTDLYDLAIDTAQVSCVTANGTTDKPTGILQYERATYLTSTTDLTSLTKINAESNGTITLNNTDNVDMPNLISYNAIIKHALATAVKQEGFNVWDEEWEVGGISPATGLPTTNTHYIRSKNLISIIPNTTYYFKSQKSYGTNNNALRITYYDNNGNFISASWLFNASSLTADTFTTLNNASYIKFQYGDYSDTAIITTYDQSICINISNQDLNGTYKPHKPTYTRALTNNEAKYSWGITDGVRNTRVFCDDEGNAVNEGSLAVGNQDLGELSYVKAGQGKGFYTTGLTSIIKAPASNYDVANTLSKYNAVSRSDIYNDVEGLAVSVGTGNVTIYTAPLEDLSTTQFGVANSGVMLQFEKKNTDTETLDDFDYFFDCEEGDTFTLVNTEQLQCYATYSFLIKEAKSNE